jgi:ATP sulfurylase
VAAARPQPPQPPWRRGPAHIPERGQADRRDHADVGDCYGGFDAQEIFPEEVPKGALEIQIFEADNTACSTKLNAVIMMRDGKDHTKEDWVFLSGTKVRAMLSEGSQRVGPRAG